jgi:hypothetical protein
MPPDQRRVRMLFALLREAHISDRKERLNLFRWILHDPSVSSTNDLDTNEVNMIIEMLSYWKREGRLETEARQHVGDFE